MAAFRDELGLTAPSDGDMLDGVRRCSRTRIRSSSSAPPNPARRRAGPSSASATASGAAAATACSRTCSWPTRRAAPASAARWSRARSTERGRAAAAGELDVNERNAAAIALYQSFGFSALANAYDGRDLYMRLHVD
jgi:hypothetical protein